MEASFTLNAPAKINWSLYVLNKRDDGYHNILSLMHCIGLYDRLVFECSDAVELISDMQIPQEQNLAFKAASLLKAYAGVEKGARIVLCKEIPSGAGLGGGSSDAAYTLIGLNRLWDLKLGSDELTALGSRLGSDVPFFFGRLSGCAMAVAEGRGEILKPLKAETSHALLIVKPSISVATSWAYANIKPENDLTKIEDKINNIQLIFRAVNSGDNILLKALAHNDFEGIVIEKHPVIGDIKNKLLDAGAALALMSGSGSAVFGLFKDMRAAAGASRHFPEHWSRAVETLM
jgi:4-diphosphocytidyl-2-C-methyl-D-erythritol kinase